MTTKIRIAPHLKEYVLGKFNDLQDGPVRFPDHSDLYHFIYDLLARRPHDHPVDDGNLEIVLPNRGVGKSPLTYNFLSEKAVSIIEKRIRVMMFAELHEFLDEYKHRLGFEYQESVHLFMRKYGIENLSEDALIKNYYRWRELLRKKKVKRKYKKNNQ